VRTRLIRPEFFTDEKMAELSVQTRLVYVGLWCLTDDAGFFELSPRAIAVTLFPYDALRESMVDLGLEELKAAERVKPLACGVHAVIPTIPEHRIKGGEQLFTIRKRHERRCLAPLRSPTDSVELHSPTSGYVPVSVSDSVSDSLSAQALEEAATAAGGFVAGLAAKKGARS
jgi:hypothetical protein